MARKPTIKVGALLRSFASCVREISYSNVDTTNSLTQDLGALVRDSGSEATARMTAELRRKAIDPRLDLTSLSGFVRPGREQDEE